MTHRVLDWSMFTMPFKQTRSSLHQLLVYLSMPLLSVSSYVYNNTRLLSFSELNDTEFTRPYYNMTIHNQHWTTLVYNLSSIGAATVNPFIEGDDSVQVSAQYTTNYGSVHFLNGLTYSTSMLLSVPPGQSAVVRVKFSPPGDADPHLFPIFSGFVTVTVTGAAASSSPKVSVPYAGMVGRWKQAPVWSRQSAQLGSPTGIYDGVTDEPISDYGSVSATNGSILAIVASTSSRFGEVQVLRHSDNSRYIVVAEFLDANFFAPLGLNSLTYFPLARMAPTAGQCISAPNFALWNGLATTNSSSTNNIQLAPGLYTIFFVAQKHFANATDPLDTVSTTFYLTA